jgi:5'-nucleotidase
MRIRFGFLACIVLFTYLLPAAASGQQTAKRITILQLNDVYQISPVDRGRRGGMARVAALVKQIRAESPNTLFLIAGDFISPSIASRLFKGKQMIAALNATGLDIATLGNHEFDFGPDVLRERMRESKFAYTLANVLERKTGKPFGGASQFIMRDMDGVRVGIFGLLLPETASLSDTGVGLRFIDPIATGRRLAQRLRRQGADVVIALTHLSMRDDKRLAAEANIDVIIGGHEHELLEALVGRTLILKMGSDARNLGRVDINLAPTRRIRRGKNRRVARRVSYRIASMDFVPVPVTDGIKEDPDVAKLVAGYEQQLNASLGEVVGKTSVALEARASIIRRGESNLGNFLADVYRSSMGSDVALVNSGSIRSDTTYGPGELTKKDILSILPFENTIVKVEITGAHLKRLLENGVSVAGQEDGRFPQVSGMSFTYDASKPAGSRIASIIINGTALSADKSYTMAISAFILGGGDGYDFKGAKVLIKPEDGPVEPDLVIEAIKKAGSIAPLLEGRIKSVTQTALRSIELFRKAA